VARANAVGHSRVFQRFALTEIAELSLTEAPCTNDLYRSKCNVAIGVPSDARDASRPLTTLGAAGREIRRTQWQDLVDCRYSRASSRRYVSWQVTQLEVMAASCFRTASLAAPVFMASARASNRL
jgi:hypothetical protein